MAALESELASMRDDHAGTIATTEQRHKVAMDAAVASHSAALSAEQSRLDAVAKEHASQLSEATMQSETAHAELANQHGAALDAASAAAERDRERLESELAQTAAEKESVAAAFESELASVRESRDAAIATAVAAAEVRHKEALSALQTQLDDATASPPEPLARWLHEAKLGQYEETVASQGYDLELLRSLSDDEAASVAAELIPPERGADRMRLRKAVQKMRQPEPEPEPEADVA